jgi:bifunctional DNA-binding transcriptional regulator/antitoxin component of YhaV-PrlF toxin-antitoxin module
MKNAVIPRHIDGIGRMAIPIEFRRELGIPTDKDVKVYLSAPSEDGIITMTIDSLQPNAVIQETLGFLILPQTYRYSNGLNDCTLDLWIEDGRLHMKKTVPQCVISGDTENLVRYKNTDKYLSEQIIRDLYESLDKK